MELTSARILQSCRPVSAPDWQLSLVASWLLPPKPGIPPAALGHEHHDDDEHDDPTDAAAHTGAAPHPADSAEAGHSRWADSGPLAASVLDLAAVKPGLRVELHHRTFQPVRQSPVV